MLDANQKLLLSQEVLTNKSILFGPLTPGITNKIRDQIWQKITNLLIANGASADLTTYYVKHTEWQNLTRSVTNKFKKHLKSGEEGNLKLNTSAKHVIILIGNQSYLFHLLTSSYNAVSN